MQRKDARVFVMANAVQLHSHTHTPTQLRTHHRPSAVGRMVRDRIVATRHGTMLQRHNVHAHAAALASRPRCTAGKCGEARPRDGRRAAEAAS